MYTRHENLFILSRWRSNENRLNVRVVVLRWAETASILRCGPKLVNGYGEQSSKLTPRAQRTSSRPFKTDSRRTALSDTASRVALLALLEATRCRYVERLTKSIDRVVLPKMSQCGFIDCSGTHGIGRFRLHPRSF